MGTYKEIDGDLITLAMQGMFDVIAHGANSFCSMGAGIAPQMAKAFGCDNFKLERLFNEEYDDSGLPIVVKTNNKGNINKLGQVDYDTVMLETSDGRKLLTVINAYTQYYYGKNHIDGVDKPVDYEAITLCMRKINHLFKGKTIGLPYIGCGLAGGDVNIILPIIKKELKDMNVVMVKYKQ